MRTLPLAPRLAQLSDSQLELAIHLSHRRLISASDIPSKAAAWRVMCQLIKGRSPQTVARMEQERGLAKPQ
jgi:hypothetical protein